MVVCASWVVKLKEHLLFCKELSILCIENRVVVYGVEEGFQLARELDKHGERGRDPLGMGNHTINILIICIKTGTSLVK